MIDCVRVPDILFGFPTEVATAAAGAAKAHLDGSR
jgi:hypothetical protein